MTPEQIAILTEVRDLALATQQRCGPCVEELQRHRVILDGEPGNGEHPGLRTRMAVSEETCDEIKKTQAGSAKWMRTQLGVFIAAAVAVIAKWTAKG